MPIVTKSDGGQMLKLQRSFSRFCRDESGATAIEYGLIAGLISLAMIGSLAAIGTHMRDDIFNRVTTALNNALASAGL